MFAATYQESTGTSDNLSAPDRSVGVFKVEIISCGFIARSAAVFPPKGWEALFQVSAWKKRFRHIIIMLPFWKRKLMDRRVCDCTMSHLIDSKLFCLTPNIHQTVSVFSESRKKWRQGKSSSKLIGFSVLRHYTRPTKQ